MSHHSVHLCVLTIPASIKGRVITRLHADSRTFPLLLSSITVNWMGQTQTRYTMSAEPEPAGRKWFK